MRLNKRIAFIGGGNMTEAMVVGLLKAEVADPDQMYVTDILPERCRRLEAQYHIRVGTDNRIAAEWGHVLVLSVEPQVLDAVLDEISLKINDKCLVISVVAGYPISRITEKLRSADTVTLIRAMPNTPSGILEGATALSPASGASEEDRRTAQTIFAAVGKVVEVEERLMDAVTGLSGSGPAFIFLMIEALADGGVKMGLPRSVAELLAAQTLQGAARMVLESGEHPGRLKDRVASPGGTTIAGIHALERGGLRGMLMSAVEAATKRSQELGKR